MTLLILAADNSFVTRKIFVTQIFDGHGGPDASAYIKRHAIRFLFEDAGFPHADEPDEDFMKSVENSIKSAFDLADLALADECTISSSSGTTALIALVFGRYVILEVITMGL